MEATDVAAPGKGGKGGSRGIELQASNHAASLMGANGTMGRCFAAATRSDARLLEISISSASVRLALMPHLLSTAARMLLVSA